MRELRTEVEKTRAAVDACNGLLGLLRNVVEKADCQLYPPDAGC